jgi:hypothetical protein
MAMGCRAADARRLRAGVTDRVWREREKARKLLDLPREMRDPHSFPLPRQSPSAIAARDEDMSSSQDIEMAAVFGKLHVCRVRWSA